MKLLLFISDLIMPLTIAVIIMYGISKKVDLFDNFILGAKDGFKTVFNIAPTIIGLIVAVSVLRASGALELFSNLITPITNLINFPKEAVPLSLMRLVSSSASNGLLIDIYKEHGPDSFIGRFVSIMMSSTETVFYTLSLYFMSVKITKTRYTLSSALIANFAGIFFSLWLTIFLFGK